MIFTIAVICLFALIIVSIISVHSHTKDVVERQPAEVVDNGCLNGYEERTKAARNKHKDELLVDYTNLYDFIKHQEFTGYNDHLISIRFAIKLLGVEDIEEHKMNDIEINLYRIEKDLREKGVI